MTEYISKWDSSEIIKFDEERLKSLGLSEEQFEFLRNTGLPIDAAPFLSFEDEVQHIEEVYQTGERSHRKLYIIGSDNNGDPICIDTSDQRKVVLCDHEDGFSTSFMNATVIELFQFLTAMKVFIEILISERGEDAYMDCDFTDEQYQHLEDQLQSINPLALASGTFWANVLERLKADREYYRNETNS